MIGDKLVFLEKHYKKASKIKNFLLEQVNSNLKKKKYVISIGGESGTGKTEIAYILRKYLWKAGFSSYVISLDDYYIVDWRLRNEHRQVEGIETVGLKEIDWVKLETILYEFDEKTKVHLQEINKFLGGIEKKTISSAFDFLIIEGLYSCHLSSDYRIYLEGSIQQTKKFRIKRAKEPQTEFREQVLEKEKKDVRSTKKRAHLTIPFR